MNEMIAFHFSVGGSHISVLPPLGKDQNAAALPAGFQRGGASRDGTAHPSAGAAAAEHQLDRLQDFLQLGRTEAPPVHGQSTSYLKFKMNYSTIINETMSPTNVVTPTVWPRPSGGNHFVHSAPVD